MKANSKQHSSNDAIVLMHCEPDVLPIKIYLIITNCIRENFKLDKCQQQYKFTDYLHVKSYMENSHSKFAPKRKNLTQSARDVYLARRYAGASASPTYTGENYYKKPKSSLLDTKVHSSTDTIVSTRQEPDSVANLNTTATPITYSKK